MRSRLVPAEEVKSPSALLMTAIFAFVLALVTTTFALATAAPLLSVTVPTMLPVAVCDRAAMAQNNRYTTSRMVGVVIG
jgi:hypothetical protein